jgi:hypothetical protein
MSSEYMREQGEYPLILEPAVGGTSWWTVPNDESYALVIGIPR